MILLTTIKKSAFFDRPRGAFKVGYDIRKEWKHLRHRFSIVKKWGEISGSCEAVEHGTGTQQKVPLLRLQRDCISDTTVGEERGQGRRNLPLISTKRTFWFDCSTGIAPFAGVRGHT